MAASTKSTTRQGEQAWAKVPKVNGEVFALTYGAMVIQLIKDYEAVDEVNKQLEKMGYNIGVRIIDEFLAKSGTTGHCRDHRETADVIAKVSGMELVSYVLGASGACGGRVRLPGLAQERFYLVAAGLLSARTTLNTGANSVPIVPATVPLGGL